MHGVGFFLCICVNCHGLFFCAVWKIKQWKVEKGRDVINRGT